jgi:hypothetical protein
MNDANVKILVDQIQNLKIVIQKIKIKVDLVQIKQ